MTAQVEVRPLQLILAITARRRPHLLGELLVVVALLRVYDMARAKAEVRHVAAIANGETILNIERWLHFDIEQVANVWVTSHRWLSLVASDIYQFAHITVTLAVLAWCWWRRPELYRPARNALVLINLTALAVFLLLPVAPPRLLPGYGFVDAVELAGFGTTHSGPVPADQYGAVPSLHVAWAVWATVVATRLLAPGVKGRLCWLYPALVTVVVVVTGNHYLLDAVAGIAVALGALAVVRVVRWAGTPFEDRSPSHASTPAHVAAGRSAPAQSFVSPGRRRDR